jgi:hypothetical protein
LTASSGSAFKWPYRTFDAPLTIAVGNRPMHT